MQNKKISPLQNAIKEVLSEAEEEEIGCLINCVFGLPDVSPLSIEDFQNDLHALLKKGLVRAEIKGGSPRSCVSYLSPEQAVERINIAQLLKISRSGGWYWHDPDILDGQELVIIDNGLKTLP